MDYTTTTYMDRLRILNNHYDKMMDYDVTRNKSLFEATTYRADEYRTAGSLRSFLHKQYALLNIRKTYGLSIIEWFSQPICIMYHQMSDIDEIVLDMEDAAKAAAATAAEEARREAEVAKKARY